MADLLNWCFAVQILPALARGAVVSVEAGTCAKRPGAPVANSTTSVTGRLLGISCHQVPREAAAQGVEDEVQIH
jgi:hypothetical protein